MFHNLLCDLGYTIIDIDYSASAGYGRDFRTSIYRHMGGQDLNDQIAGRQYLIANENIVSNKVGIYGGRMVVLSPLWLYLNTLVIFNVVRQYDQ